MGECTAPTRLLTMPLSTSAFVPWKRKDSFFPGKKSSYGSASAFLRITPDLVVLPTRRPTSKQIVLAPSLSYSSRRGSSVVLSTQKKPEKKIDARLKTNMEKQTKSKPKKHSIQDYLIAAGANVGMKRKPECEADTVCDRAKKQNSTVPSSEKYTWLDILAMDVPLPDECLRDIPELTCPFHSSHLSLSCAAVDSNHTLSTHTQKDNFFDEGNTADGTSVNSTVESKEKQSVGYTGYHCSCFTTHPPATSMQTNPSQHEHGSVQMFHEPVPTTCVTANSLKIVSTPSTPGHIRLRPNKPVSRCYCCTMSTVVDALQRVVPSNFYESKSSNDEASRASDNEFDKFVFETINDLYGVKC